MRYAICNELYGERSLADACRHAYQAGYRGIEIAPFTLGGSIFDIDAGHRLQLRGTIEQSGLAMVGFHWLLAGTRNLHLTSTDGAVQNQTYAYLAELTRLCRDLGGRVLVFGSPQQRSLVDGISSRQARKVAVKTLKRLDPVLQECQVTLAFEPLGPEETNFINTAREAIDLLQEVDSPLVRLQLDVKAMSTEPESIPDIIRSSGDWLTHFHANDPNRQGPGMGQTDFEPILKSLRQIGYSGWISVEVFDGTPGIDALVHDSIGYLKQTWDRLEHRR